MIYLVAYATIWPNPSPRLRVNANGLAGRPPRIHCPGAPAERALTPLPCEPTLTDPAPDDLPLERTLSFRLLMLHKLSERDSAGEFLQALGLTPSDGRALATLGAFEPLSVVALAEACSLNKGQASRAAQALVDQGLADKRDSAADGRGVVLTLTPAGRELHARTVKLVNQRSRRLFGCLSQAEQQLFSDLLDRLIEQHRAHAAPPGSRSAQGMRVASMPVSK